MPSTSFLEEAPRRDLTIFYILDSSGSMEGAKIAKLNMAMGETIEALKDVAKSNSDAKLKVAVMRFDSDVSWMTSNGPEYVEEDFHYTPIEHPYGLTEVGAALRELDDKLSVKKFMKSAAGSFIPVIIFMTDGIATDEYTKALHDIRENKWFKRATKIGFKLYNDDDDVATREAGVSMLASVVGNIESVIETSDLDMFARLIKFVSVTASMLASQTATTHNTVPGADVIKSAEGIPADVVPSGVAYDPEPQDTGGGAQWEDPEDW